MSTKRFKITALIPCYNEAGGIASVLKSFPLEKIDSQGFDFEVVVIDNSSTDGTGEIAKNHGATVLHEPRKGKGNAIRLGFEYAVQQADYIVMLDGDDTYRPQEILRLIEPLDSDFCNVVIGSRLGGKIKDGSMPIFNRMGNWIYSHLVRYFYRVNVTDVLTGYFAWKRDALERLRPHLKSSGFAIEMEMVTKMARLGEQIYSVPISYDARAGESNLRPIYDGSRILLMFARNLVWKPKTQKIAFVSDAVMPYNKGGKERRLYEISKRLVNDFREVHIYTMKWWEGPDLIQVEGVYFHAISRLYPLYSHGKRSIYQAVMFGIATLKLLFSDFDVLDVDHMPFFPLFSARVVTWIKGQKLNATWHEVWGQEYWREYLGGVQGWIGHIIESISFMLPDTIISNSDHTTGRLKLAGYKGQIRTVPLGVDFESIRSVKKAEHESDIIFVGRLLSNKNVGLLVEAIEQVKSFYPNLKCRIIGDGPERSQIEKLITQFGLEANIQISDFMDNHDDLYGLMKASKMLVLPSSREGFGLVVLEANAAGLPVVTTSHKDNAAKDLILDGVNGFLADLTADSIAEKIIQTLDQYKTMHPEYAIAQYNWVTVVKKMEQVFG